MTVSLWNKLVSYETYETGPTAISIRARMRLLSEIEYLEIWNSNCSFGSIRSGPARSGPLAARPVRMSDDHPVLVPDSTISTRSGVAILQSLFTRFTH